MLQTSTLVTAAAAAAVLTLSAPASATILDGIVNDDAWVQADDESFNDNRLRVRDDNTASAIRKTFIEFTLPAVPAGEVIDSATFSIYDFENETGKDLGTAGARTLRVFGIIDESVENFDEAVVSYATAPANDSADPRNGSVLSDTQAIELGTIDIGSSQTAGSCTQPEQLGFRASFLASDTNGIVTFGLISNENTGHSTMLFASSENTTVRGPALTVTTVVPEPASAGLLLLGSGALGLASPQVKTGSQQRRATRVRRTGAWLSFGLMSTLPGDLAPVPERRLSAAIGCR